MSRRPVIGILGGSFNPVHAGHIMLADYLAQFSGAVDEVWLMLSPLNPIKENPGALIADSHRLAMLRIATSATPGLRVCDIELSMPRPSYTINSLERLRVTHPDCDFRLIIGSDNWLVIDRWRDSERIITDYAPIVYPRPDYDTDATAMRGNAILVKAPTVDISSTFIRDAIAAGHNMNSFLPHGVMDYINEHNLYR